MNEEPDDTKGASSDYPEGRGVRRLQDIIPASRGRFAESASGAVIEANKQGAGSFETVPPVPVGPPRESQGPALGWLEDWIKVGSSAASVQDRGLGFNASTVLVDNWTSQWLFIPAVRRYIPPYTGGWMIPIQPGTNRGQVLNQAPIGTVALTAVANEVAWVAWAESQLPPSAGVGLLEASLSTSAPSRVRVQDGISNNLAIVSPPSADGAAVGTLNTLGVFNAPYLYNGLTWDRARSASALAIGAQSGLGTTLAASPGEWSIVSTPAANTQATVTKAASAGVRHVARAMDTAYVAGTVAPAATNVLVNLRDSTTGAGTILWSVLMATQAVAGDKDDYQSDGRNVVGTAGNAMTLEFAAAGGANTLETVSLGGYDAS